MTAMLLDEVMGTFDVTEAAHTIVLSEQCMPGWVLLGERADTEIAFGAVGVVRGPHHARIFALTTRHPAR